ncbi:hypothetical protein K439DRAFT_601379 [Ramaria rubella]|nr:hypothetical protein K439DRAFT_601379 [Ramaria rubella]
MSSSSEIKPTFNPHQPVKPNCTLPSAGPGYAFLANPPKLKHKPQPIATRCLPPRSLPRSTSRRRASISGSPAFQTSFLSLATTPTPDTPKTPRTPKTLLTNHGYAAPFATYPRRGSIPDVQYAQVPQGRRVPSSPKQTPPLRSAPNSPKHSPTSGSPKRRQHRVPSLASPFAPPSPTRPRSRAKSITTRIPVPVSPAPVIPRPPKLSKIRSLTNLRARSPSLPPSKPVMVAPSTPKPTSKRAKRSATPARGSNTYAKYRPMPFIQQMQMIQFLEGGTLESHIRRHHIHAGQGTAHTGFATAPTDDVVHGYAFTDERGMIWFDEEEEWEFACLLPRTRPQRRRGIRRLLGKRQDDEGEDDWEDFVEADEEEEDVEVEVLLARRDDDLRAGDDDLASFGGALEGAWARARPGRSVLDIPDSKAERKRKRAGRIISSVPVPTPALTPEPTLSITALKEEFLASAFTPPPARTSPSLTLSTSTFQRTTSPSGRRPLFQRQHRAGQSFSSLGASLRGGDVLDRETSFAIPLSPTVEWATASTEMLGRVSSESSSCSLFAPQVEGLPDVRLRSVSPPPAAARRLGIDPSMAVSLQPVISYKKGGFGRFKGKSGN